MVQVIQYSPANDEYLLGYYGDVDGDGGGEGLVGHLSPDGVFSNQIVIGGGSNVNGVELQYNPIRDEYLFLTRNDSPPDIKAHFLDANGNKIGSSIKLGQGMQPRLAFSPDSGRYFVAWDKGGNIIQYATVDGDSTNPTPILKTGTIESKNALSVRVEYGSVPQKFLVVYTFLQSTDNIFGRFVPADGMSLGARFAIDNNTQDQQTPVVGYDERDNRWVVAYQSWQAGGLPDVIVRLIDPSGNITRTFKAASTSAWEIPRAVVYNPTTETVVFGWRHSGSVEDTRAREWDVSDGGARAVGDVIIVSDDNPSIEDGAARPHPTDPQVTVLWRVNNGGDGVHAGIIHVSPPTPDTTPPAAVTDLGGSPGGPNLDIDPASITPVDASSENGSHPMGDATDGDFASYFSTVGVSTQQDAWITWDLGTSKQVNSLTLWSRTAGNLFPEDYEIQLSQNGVDFSTVASITGAVVPQGTSIQHTFPAQPAQFVKLLVTKQRQASGGNFKVQIAEVQFTEAQNTPGEITLTWTAPGDDGNVGAAKTYHLKWSQSPIDDTNFDAATDVTGLAPPQLAGNTETVTVTGLPDEDLIYFALKTEDEAMNVSAISNVPVVSTPGIPPAPVDDLVASNPGGDSADLSWSATGDDGMTGNNGAGSYDLRWATVPINDGNFGSANPIAVPFSPGPVGSSENLTVTGLPVETTVYFGIKVLDEVGNASPTDISSTEPSVTTLDLSPPSPITDLREDTAGAPLLLVAPATDASGEVTAAKGPASATDGDPGTYWGTPARAPQNEYITLDTGSVHSVVRVKLLSRTNNAKFFPEDVEVQLSNSPTSGFVTVATFSGLPATVATWHTLDIPPSMGQYVRILVTKARQTSTGKIKVHIAEIEVYESSTIPGQIKLLWTAPGDNGMLGTASSYDLRWSESPITAGNWDSASVFPFALPAPKPSGSNEAATVTGLPDESQIYFAMTASDDAVPPNVSLLSNVASAWTAGIAPDPIDDFTASNVTGTTVDLSWTAVGDDGSAGGPADHYEVRMSSSPITEANFDLATLVSGIPNPPAAPGGSEGFTVTGLTSDSSFYFAIKVFDDAGNVSPIQTNGDVLVTTPDITPPGQVTDLAASAGSATLDLVTAPAIDSSGDESTTLGKEKTTDGDPATYWSSIHRVTEQNEFVTLDMGSVRTISRVRMLSRSSGKRSPEDLEVQVSNDNVTFFTVHQETGLPDTAGMWHTFDFASVSGRYVRILMTKIRLAGGLYFAQVAEIEVYESMPAGSFTLSWTSPGDDPGAGSPASYDIRYATSPIVNNSDFNAATPLTGEPVPGPFGTSESFSVVAPEEGMTLYFALKASDEAMPPNVSPLSNGASFTTAIVPPAAVIDLAVTRVTSVSMDLSWTATGDDGLIGQATSYVIKMSTSPIDASNFDAATTVSGAPTPGAPGTPQSMEVTGLSSSTSYYFAMKVEDENMAASPISNVVSATTEGPDTTPPSDITDLRGGPPVNLTLLSAPAVDSSGDQSTTLSKEKTTDKDPTTYWSSPWQSTMRDEYVTVDIGSVKTISRVKMLSRNAGKLFPEDLEIQVSDDNVTFTTVHQAFGLPDTAGMWHTFDFTPVTARYVRVYMTKIRITSGLYRAHVAEIEVYESTVLAGDITLEWTAPGDDLGVGTATEYDLRWSPSPITAGNFLGANPLTTNPPQLAGTAESTTVSGLPSGTLYFAIRARDERPAGWALNISNVLVVDNP